MQARQQSGVAVGKLPVRRQVHGIHHGHGEGGYLAGGENATIALAIIYLTHPADSGLDEQAFRFNERQDKDVGRFRTASGSISGKRLTYKALTGKDDPEQQPRRGG